MKVGVLAVQLGEVSSGVNAFLQHTPIQGFNSVKKKKREYRLKPASGAHRADAVSGPGCTLVWTN